MVLGEYKALHSRITRKLQPPPPPPFIERLFKMYIEYLLIDFRDGGGRLSLGGRLEGAQDQRKKTDDDRRRSDSFFYFVRGIVP